VRTDLLFDFLAANTPGESVDVLVTWVGAATLVRYLVVINRRRERSPLERRATFLIGTLAALCLLRGFSWLHPDVRWLGVLMLVPATLLPLAMTLFAEGLLRRHLERSMKALAVVLTAATFLVNVISGIVGADDLIANYVLVGALLVMMGVLGVALLGRDRASLSRAESGLVQVCVVVTIIGLPLAATDFRFLLGFPPVRLGTLAILLFCYTLARRPGGRAPLASWSRDVGRVLIRAAVVCGLLLLAMRPAPRELMIPLFVLASALVLAFGVNDRLARTTAHGERAALLRWLARPPATTLRDFRRELHHLPLTTDALVLEEADLAPYDRDALRAALAGNRPVRSLVQLRADSAANSAVSHRHPLAARGADELTDLLERSEMTHVALIGDSPLSLLLANVPELPGAEDADLTLAAVVRHGPSPQRRFAETPA
jgi:hypothetical protein